MHLVGHKKQIMIQFNPKKQINDVDDYIEYANCMWEIYLDTFTRENGLIRDVREDDYFDEHIAFCYTNKGIRLAEKMRTKLIKIGEDHYPNEDICIENYLYQEY
jgi:hypothetical protein